jgi:hypothetical protein
MSAYTEHGMHGEIQATFERMTASGVQPNDLTFTILAVVCCRDEKPLSDAVHLPALDGPPNRKTSKIFR